MVSVWIFNVSDLMRISEINGFDRVIPFLVELSATGVAFLYYRKLAN